MAPNDDDASVDRFLSGGQSNVDFHHRDHVRVAYGMLLRYSFPEAACLYTRELRAMAMRAGRPGAYHETVTVAFLSLVAEHMGEGRFQTFDALVDANPRLLDKTTLLRWYTPERLESDAARQTFLLPKPFMGAR